MQELGFIVGAAAIALLVGYSIRSAKEWRKNRRAKDEATAATAANPDYNG